MSAPVTRLEKYVASMILSGAGDAIGYKNGAFEFCHSGAKIHEEVEKLGGLDQLKIQLPDWSVSDDTVMQLASAEALVVAFDSGKDHIKEYLFTQIARRYVSCMDDMAGRAPGITCKASIATLKPSLHEGYHLPYNPRGGGCGAAMRSTCIGLRYPRESELDDLIAVSVESGRMTHHHPTGYLGGVAAAFMTTCAIQDKEPVTWGQEFMLILPRVKQYIQSCNLAVTENLKDWDYFEQSWRDYLNLRGISEGGPEVTFPEDYGISERDQFYKSISFCGMGGASGHDATIIAYDALLGSGCNWLELCRRGMLHGGDSDSTGVIAAAWFGALYGFKTVPKGHYENVEYLVRLKRAGEKLCKMTSNTS